MFEVPNVGVNGSVPNVKSFFTSNFVLEDKSTSTVDPKEGVLAEPEETSRVTTDRDDTGFPVVGWIENQFSVPKLQVARWNGTSWVRLTDELPAT